MGEGSGVAVSYGVGRRRGSDPVLLWLWCRPAAVALIGPLAWELPHVVGVALKSPKKRGGENMSSLAFLSKSTLNAFFFFCLFAISWATLMAYGGSQARGGPIGAVATSLHHSHSNTGSEPRLQPTPQLMAMAGSLTH